MTDNLDIADNLVKYILALLVIVCYFARIVSGPVAIVLVLLALVMLLIAVVKLFITLITRD